MTASPTPVPRQQLYLFDEPSIFREFKLEQADSINLIFDYHYIY